MKILTMTIKKKWFDLIKSGEKTVEYRDVKPYWKARFDYNLGFPYTHILFKNGYRKESPSFIIEIRRVDIINGETEFKNGIQYAIELGRIIKKQKGYENMTVEIIVFRSDPSYYYDEHSDLKNNTVRELDINDERFLKLLAYKYRGWIEGELKIEIRNSFNPDKYFQRDIQHICVWCGLVIITWKPLKVKEG